MVSAFASFIKAVNLAVESIPDHRAVTLAVRDRLIDALNQPSFLVDCVDGLVSRFESPSIAGPLEQLYYHPLGWYSVTMFCWPPGKVNEPHQHDEWTVTGVMFNTLQFRTYRQVQQPASDGDSTGGLIQDKFFNASAGEVGYICTTCIHNVANPSERSSASLHVFSDPPELAPLSPPPPLSGHSEHMLTTCAEMLSTVRHPRNLDLLDRLFAVGTRRSKLASIKAMSGFDPHRAARRANEFAAVVPEPLRSRLQQISVRLNQEA